MADINPGGNVFLIFDKIPKTVCDTSDAAYIYVAEAKSPDTPTTSVGWRRFRLTRGSLAVDWAQDVNGNETDDFVFTGVEADLSSSTYGE